jgi:molybdenum cofactor synthesis domain-containing protein
MTPSNPPRTAAALIIGDELLTGKVRDKNVTVLARDLFGLGIALRRVVFCPDEVEVIAADLDALRRAHDYVVTSGGVGPTHDDVTMAAVARAFGRRLERSPVIEELLREFFGERLSERHLRMADLPQGAALVTRSGGRWPAVRIANVFVLPGLPEIFRRKLPILRQHLAGGAPFVSRAVGTRSDEGDLAELLEQLSGAHPEVKIGSYPRWADEGLRVKVTFDGRRSREVDRAVAAFVAALPAEQIVEGGS